MSFTSRTILGNFFMLLGAAILAGSVLYAGWFWLADIAHWRWSHGNPFPFILIGVVLCLLGPVVHPSRD